MLIGSSPTGTRRHFPCPVCLSAKTIVTVLTGLFYIPQRVVSPFGLEQYVTMTEIIIIAATEQLDLCTTDNLMNVTHHFNNKNVLMS